jgi:FtsH-binding integral membrane protein
MYDFRQTHMNDIWSYAATLILFAIMVWTLRLCVDNARRRGKSPFLVFISFPLGLVLWLLFRPEPVDGAIQLFV